MQTRDLINLSEFIEVLRYMKREGKKNYNAGSLKVKFQKNMSQTRIFKRHKKEIKWWHNFSFLIKRGKTKDAKTYHLQQ